MRTLSRHLLSQQLSFFAGALIVFFAIGTVAEILGHLEEIVEQWEKPDGALPGLFLRVVDRYADDAIPSASFAACLLCLGLAARRGELTGLRASGVAPKWLAGRLLLVAGVLSLATLLVNETWLLDARRTLSALEAGSTARPQTGPLWYHSGQALYNAAQRASDGSLRELAIFDLDPRGRVVAATHVARVPSDRMGVPPDARRWQLGAAARTRFDPANPVWSAADSDPSRSERAAVDLHGADHASVRTTAGLTALFAAGKGAGADARRNRLALQARLARAASVLVFALLAVPLALSVGHGASLAGPALAGAGLLAVYHGVGAAGELAAQRGWLPVWLGAWLASGLLVAGAGIALRRATR